MQDRWPRAPVVGALLYAFVGSVYIVSSDRALQILTGGNIGLYAELQTYKGWSFILVTSLFLWFILSIGFRALTIRARTAEQAEMRLRLAIDTAGGAVWTARGFGEDIQIQGWGSLVERLGLTPDMPEPLARVEARMHPDDLPAIEALQSWHATQGSGRTELTCRMRDDGGNYHWLKIVAERAEARQEGDPDIPTNGVALDITEIVETSEQLKDAIRGGNLGVWRLDLRTGRNEVNEIWTEMVGLEPEVGKTFTLDQFHGLLGSGLVLAS